MPVEPVEKLAKKLAESKLDIAVDSYEASNYASTRWLETCETSLEGK